MENVSTEIGSVASTDTNKFYLPVCTNTMLHKHNPFNHINGYDSIVANALHLLIIQSYLHSNIINIHLNTLLTYI